MNQQNTDIVTPILLDIKKILDMHLKPVLTNMYSDYNIYKSTHETIRKLPIFKELLDQNKLIQFQVEALQKSNHISLNSANEKIHSLNNKILNLEQKLANCGTDDEVEGIQLCINENDIKHEDDSEVSKKIEDLYKETNVLAVNRNKSSSESEISDYCSADSDATNSAIDNDTDTTKDNSENNDPCLNLFKKEETDSQLTELSHKAVSGFDIAEEHEHDNISDVDTEASNDLAPTFPTVEDIEKCVEDLNKESNEEWARNLDKEADEKFGKESNKDSEDEDEEEVFDIDINGTVYYTTDDQNGKIYNKGWPCSGDNEEIGELVGSFESGEVNFL